MKDIKTTENELTITEHLASGWRNFSLQKIDQMAKIEATKKEYEKTLEDIANFMENWEDYYSGVGIDYHEMINSIVKLAKTALDKGKK